MERICGRWLVSATARSCSSASTISAFAPQAAMISRTMASSRSMNHVAPSKRSARAARDAARRGTGQRMAGDEAIVGDGAKRRHHAAHRGDERSAGGGEETHGDIDRRRQNHDIRVAIERRHALVGGFAGIEIGIGSKNATRHPRRRSAMPIDPPMRPSPAISARRAEHHCVIMISVRSTVCDVEASKYGRWIVTRGRFGFGSISAARYVPTAFDGSSLRFSFCATGTIAGDVLGQIAGAVVRGRLGGAEVVRRVGRDFVVAVRLRVELRNLIERRVGVVDRDRRNVVVRTR